MILLSRLVMLLAVVVLLLFCMSNLDSITVKMIGWESPQMPLFLILLFVFFFGFFLALFWQALRSVTRKKEARSVPAVVSEPKLEKQKKERRWGKKKDKAQAQKSAEETGQEVAEPDDGAVDKNDKKDNITEGSNGVSGTEK
jgi:uncharacterized integral membrane protein